MKCVYKLGKCPLPHSVLNTIYESKEIPLIPIIQYCTLCPLRINATQHKESEFTKELEKEFLKAIIEGIKKNEGKKQ